MYENVKTPPTVTPQTGALLDRNIRQSVVTGDSSILPKGTYKIIGEVSGRRTREIILKTMLKTDSSVRSFTMNDALYNYLKLLKARQDVMPRETKAYMDFVCVNAVGMLITPDTVTAQFRKLLDKNSLPHIKFHSLRHSCISLLANNTAFSMKQIQDYAGHGDFLTTIPVSNSNTKPTQYLLTIILISKGRFSCLYARNLPHCFLGSLIEFTPTKFTIFYDLAVADIAETLTAVIAVLEPV